MLSPRTHGRRNCAASLLRCMRGGISVEMHYEVDLILQMLNLVRLRLCVDDEADAGFNFVTLHLRAQRDAGPGYSI